MKVGLRGFTIIEIIVIVSVIALLSSITVVGLSRYQATTRDSQRSAKVTVITEALEKYYEEHGEYPGCTELTDTADNLTADGAPLERVNDASLVAPLADDGVDNSITCSDLDSLDGDDIFAFIGDGSSTCNTGTSCLEFTIKYKDEVSGEIRSINSRRSTEVVTSGSISDLSVTNTSVDTIDLSWSSLPNVTQYRVQRATNSAFTTNVVDLDVSTNSAVSSGLTQATQYFFRVLPSAQNSQGNWSNTVSATTTSIPTPVISATGVSDTQIDVSWSDVATEDSYTLQYTTSSSSWTSPTPTTVPLSQNSTSYSLTGLSAGDTRYFRLRVTQEGVNGNWSTTVQGIAQIQAPPNLVATMDSTIAINLSWDSVPGAAGYLVDYSTSSGFGSYSTETVAGTSTTIDGLTDGTTYHFRVKGYLGSYEGLNSTTANATTKSVTLSGSTNCYDDYSNRPDYRVRLNLNEVSYDIAANTSNVTWSAYRYPKIYKSTGTWDETLPSGWSYSVVVNGSTVASGSQSRSGRWRSRPANTSDTERFYGTNTTSNSSYSGTVTVSHNGDGTKTISSSVYDGSNGIFGTGSCSKSYVLSDLR